ncbi:uncharacterized protein LOC126379967 isoform X2 [Pectinophora gossypiella]|nr:uncharacterized protein LOC126379967 isoform X2 [Pectinophora gossypiella]XP_049884968.1 uncharacterized protein LOC126379967 isoform X2 [Pectinophora gossypiella]
MCGDFFNTVKKGPGKVVLSAIEPPPEFQDNPIQTFTEKDTAVCEPKAVVIINNNRPVGKSISAALDVPTSSSHLSPRKLKPECLYERRQGFNQRFASPRLLHLSPCRGTRPSSRSSLSSRLSSSHNSLVTQFQADDSSFITQAISHDTLSAKTSDIADMYNVPVDSDIYAVPVDVVQPNKSNMKGKGKKPPKNKKRGKSTSQITDSEQLEKNQKPKDTNKNKDTKTKRHSLPSSSKKNNNTDSDSEPAHLTLREMRKYLHTLYAATPSETEYRNNLHYRRSAAYIASVHARHAEIHAAGTTANTNRFNTVSTAVFLTETKEVSTSTETNNNHKKGTRNCFGLNIKNKKQKDNTEDKNDKKGKMSPVKILSINLKQSFCNLFRWRKQSGGVEGGEGEASGESLPAAVRRALPPLPAPALAVPAARRFAGDDVTDFATSIQKVKDYGWYWGPLSVEAAEKILSNEPDGSFIVRDSSDDHYIFTLTFKLNGLRHVRIEHDQGNFCFGGCTMFKAATIVEFIENAVDTSRSGRYLFFLNLRPMLGPVRVQLLYPVSRFKRVQSLQHMCRFVILKHVRRDLIKNLPLPRRLLDYLSATHYYSEHISEM